MIDISKGRYWDKPWGLVDGCTPCSPGCDHCWSMAMGKRFHRWPEKVTPHPESLDIPLRTRKPTVFAVWNDLFHKDVSGSFVQATYTTIAKARQHTFLVLTKRARRMADITTGMIEVGLTLREGYCGGDLPNIWHGVTVCNQDEADAKIPELLKVPGKKWISIEPMLGEIDLSPYLPIPSVNDGTAYGAFADYLVNTLPQAQFLKRGIDLVILGGETGPGARPIHPDWVRSVRDQCQAAGVSFYFKQWGEWVPCRKVEDAGYWIIRGIKTMWVRPDGSASPKHLNDDEWPVQRVGSKRAGRLLDGREWNELPWRQS